MFEENVIKVQVVNQKWQKSSEEDTNNVPIMVLQPLLRVCSVFGTKKIKLIDGKASEIGTFEKIYAMLFFFVVYGAFAYLAYWRFFDLKANSLNYAITDLFSSSTLSIACCHAILMSVFFSSECLVTFVENVEETHAKLEMDAAEQVKLRKKILLLFVGYMTFAIVEGGFNLYGWGYNPIIAMWYVSMMIIDCTNLELMIYLHLITKEVEKVKSLLVLDSSFETRDRFNMSVSNMEDDIQRFDSGLKNKKKLELKSEKASGTKNNFSKEGILELMGIYDKIADNAHILNVTFGSAILFSSLVSFLNAITTVITYFQLNDQKKGNSFLIFSVIEWWIRCLLSTIIGVFFSEKFSGGCHQITLLLNKNIFLMEENSPSRKMLEKFVLLTSTRRVQMTACNFFNYDYTFVVSLLGALVSYTIILMQSRNEIRSA